VLKDSRVKVNEPDNDGETPLCYAARFGSPDVIKWWIASGREIELGEPGDVFMDAIGVAKEYDRTEVVSLLERLKENPVETRHAVRVELGLLDELAAEMFALVVFVSDGLLKTKATGVKAGAKRTRFFNIARRLPLELHMLLCFRQVGSCKEIIQRQRGCIQVAGLEPPVVLNLHQLTLHALPAFPALSMTACQSGTSCP